jgi:hypothetical protein
MTWLSLLLLFKIAYTLLTTVGPLLLLPARRIGDALAVGPEAIPFLRLYGVALLALLVGYSSGVPAAEAGQYPGGIVAMGLVSNAGAAVTLVRTGAWRRTPAAAPVFGAIGVGLALAAAAPEAALGRAW